MLPVALAIIGMIAGLAALRIRRRRDNRLQLRLLAGRRRLLGEEIGSYSGRLAALDPEELAADRRTADGILDNVHIALLDREAHLLNLQELANLQRHKLAVLQRRRDELPSVGAETRNALPEEKENLVESRETLEDQFLGSIQQRHDAPKPRSRRRRT
jgi:hypothetical protein